MRYNLNQVNQGAHLEELAVRYVRQSLYKSTSVVWFLRILTLTIYGALGYRCYKHKSAGDE